MKTISIALAVAASLAAITTANAWLGDSEPTLAQRYGSPRAVELSTGDIPTQKGFYVELTEAFTACATASKLSPARRWLPVAPERTSTAPGPGP